VSVLSHIYIRNLCLTLWLACYLSVSPPNPLSPASLSLFHPIFFFSLSLSVALPFSLSLSACLPLSLLSSNHWCRQRNQSQNQRHCRPRYLHFHARLHSHHRHHSKIRFVRHSLRHGCPCRCHHLNRKDYLVVCTLWRNREF